MQPSRFSKTQTTFLQFGNFSASLPVYSSPPSCTNMTEPIRNETICPLINVQTFGNFPLLSTAAKFYHQFEMRQQNLAVSYRSPGDLNIQQVRITH